MEFNIDKKEVKKPHSFTLKPSTLDLVREYADLKETTMSKTVEAMIEHFLPRVIEQEKRKKDRRRKR